MSSHFYLILPGFLMPLTEWEVPASTVPPEATPDHSFAYLPTIIFYLLCFVAVLFLASLVTRWLGRKVGGGSGRHLRLVETLPLGPNRTLHLVSVGQQLFLVAVADRNVTMLAEISDSQLLAALQVEAALREAEKEQAKGSNDFASHLKRILERGKDKERLDDQKTATAKQRIEERLMAIRTNRGQKGDG
jgi:flagellar protein FliO/FliZ